MCRPHLRRVDPGIAQFFRIGLSGDVKFLYSVETQPRQIVAGILRLYITMPAQFNRFKINGLMNVPIHVPTTPQAGQRWNRGNFQDWANTQVRPYSFYDPYAIFLFWITM